MILTGDALIEAAFTALEPHPEPEDFGPMSVDVHLDTEKPHVIETGEHWVTPAREHVDMPNDLAALLTGRSCHMRQGLFIPAGWVDPGFTSTDESPFKLEFGNTSDGAAYLDGGEAAGRLVFFRLGEETQGYDGRWGE